MRSDGFWNIEFSQDIMPHQPKSLRSLNEMVEEVSLDEDLIELIGDEDSREELVNALLNGGYFSQEERKKIKSKVDFMDSKLEGDKMVKCNHSGCEKTAEGKPEGWLCTKHEIEEKLTEDKNNFPLLIQEKLKVRRNKESIELGIEGDPPGLFVLREIAQNADDCGAEILVLEFKDDGLYVYNDGRSFTQPEDENNEYPHEFRRVKDIMSKTKKLRPEMTGSYGTGFQTVYYLTNTPEIHSFDKHIRFKPLEENVVEEINEEKRINSPYSRDKEGNTKGEYEYQGTVFRFPWREEDDTSLGLEDEPEVDTSCIPRWNHGDKVELFDSFIKYSKFLILCFQNLKKVRILNDLESSETSDLRRDYQVQKGDEGEYWTLRDTSNDGDVKRLINGEGNGGYRIDAWEYDDEVEKHDFFIKSDFVTEDEDVAFLTKPTDRSYDIEYEDWTKSSKEDSTKKYKEIKKEKPKIVERSDYHILFPLDDFTSEEYPPSYSTMPLAKRTKNNFIFTSPIKAKENRAELKLSEEGGGILKRWLKIVLKNLLQTYVEGFPKYIETIENRYDDGLIRKEKLQDMVLKNLPSSKIKGWVGAEGVSEGLPDDFDENLQRQMTNTIFEEKIYFYEDGLKRLINGDEDFHYPEGNVIRDLLQEMGHKIVGKDFFGHDRWEESDLDPFINGKDGIKEKLRLDSDAFFDVYEDFCDEEPIYEEEPYSLDFVEDLIDCWFDADFKEKDKIPVFPNNAGIIKPPDELVEMPSQYEDLQRILPEKLTIREGFRSDRIEDVIDNLSKDNIGIKEMVRGVDAHSSDIECHRERIKILDEVYDWIEECKDEGDVRLDKAFDLDSNPSFLLNAEGELVSRDEDIYWLPYKDLEKISQKVDLGDWKTKIINQDLLKRHEDQFEEYLDLFPYHRIVKDFKENIEGKDDSNREIQFLILRGVTKGLKKDRWEKDDLVEVDFFPVDGKLKDMEKICLGQIDNPKTRKLLGVIDDAIQEKLKDENLYDFLLENLDINDLSVPSERCEWIVEKIDDFAKRGNHALNGTPLKEEEHDIDGTPLTEVEPLTEEEHDMISKSLMEIDWDDDKTDLDLLFGKNILPIKFSGEIYLDSLPPRELKGDEKLKEKYKRTYPFLLNDIVEKEVPDEIIESLKHVFIKGIDEIEEHLLYKDFPLLPLIESGGSAPERIYMMHFVVPGENGDGKSLFIEEELRNFLIEDDISQKTIDSIRESFVTWVFNIYEGGQKTIDDYNAKKAPCIPKDTLSNPDSIDEDWITPDRILTSCGEKNILDYALIDEKALVNKFSLIDELDEPVPTLLQHMGALGQPRVKKFKESIKKILDDKESSYRSDLIDMFFYLIKNEVVYVDKKENRPDEIKDTTKIVDKTYWKEDVEEFAWVPTEDNLKEITETVAPIEDIREVLGDYKPDNLIDLGLMDDEDFETLKENKESLVNQGVEVEANPELLCECYDHHAKEKIKPSDKLLNKIEIKIRKDEINKHSFSESYYYFDDIGWKKPGEVIIEEDSTLPQLLEEDYHIVSSYTNQDLFDLMRKKDGVETTGLELDEILDSLSGCQNLEKGKDTWDYFLKNLGELKNTSGSLSDYVDEDIFPFEEESFYEPKNIILPGEDEDDELKHKGPLGEYLSISREDDSSDVLRNIGAPTLRGLGEEDEGYEKLFYSCIDKYKKTPKKREDESKLSNLEKDIQFFLSLFIKSNKIEDQETIKLESDKNFIPIYSNIDKEKFSSPNDVILTTGMPKDILEDLEENHNLSERVDTVDYSFICDSDEFKKILKAQIEKDSNDKRGLVEDWLKKNGVKHIIQDDILDIDGEPSLEDSDVEGYNKELHDWLKESYLQTIDRFSKYKLELEDYDILKDKIDELKDYNPYCIKELNVRYELDMSDIDGGRNLEGSVIRDTFKTEKPSHTIIWYPTKSEKNPEKLLRERFVEEMKNPLKEGYPRKMLQTIDEYLARDKLEEISLESLDIDSCLESLEDWWVDDYIEDNDGGIKDLPTFSSDKIWPYLKLDDWEDGYNSVEERDEKIKETLEGSIDDEARELFFRMLSVLTFWSAPDNINKAKEFLRNEVDLGQIYNDNIGEFLKEQLEDWADKDKSAHNLYPKLKRRYMDILAIRETLKDPVKGPNMMSHMMNDLNERDAKNLFQFLRDGKASGVPGSEPIIRGFKGSFTRNIYFIVREFERLGLAEGWDNRAFHISRDVRKLFERLGQEIDRSRLDGNWRTYYAEDLRRKTENYEGLHEHYDLPFQAYVNKICDDCNHNSGDTCRPDMNDECIFHRGIKG